MWGGAQASLQVHAYPSMGSLSTWPPLTSCNSVPSWHAIIVDGHSVEELCKAFGQARHQPTAVIAKTFKGRGITGLDSIPPIPAPTYSLQQLGSETMPLSEYTGPQERAGGTVLPKVTRLCLAEPRFEPRLVWLQRSYYVRRQEKGEKDGALWTCGCSGPEGAASSLPLVGTVQNFLNSAGSPELKGGMTQPQRMWEALGSSRGWRCAPIKQ